MNCLYNIEEPTAGQQNSEEVKQNEVNSQEVKIDTPNEDEEDDHSGKLFFIFS